MSSIQTSEILARLNEQQQEAVLHQDGPAMVLAGAGSGKTTVLTHRVAWLMAEKEVLPHQIMLVTFTNKAAHEMKQRVRNLTGNDLSFAGTFHSLCARILRQHGPKIGLPHEFVIYDTDDQLALMKIIYRDHSISTKKFHPKAVLYAISDAKNDMITWEEMQESAYGEYKTHLARMYKLYQRGLHQSGAVDFDDLLLKVLELFERQPQVLAEYQKQLTHVLVDEYQDTNKAQYLLTKALAAPHQNLYVVGDFSQSIYAWRGADYRNMLALTTDYGGITEYRLERNYRSIQPILDAATAVISQNSSHPVLHLWTDQTETRTLVCYQARDWEDEAMQVVRYVRQHQSEYPLSQMAILYRTNAQSRAFEEACVRAGIPYKVLGGFKFYERKEVKDVLAYLRYLINQEDSVSHQRAVKQGKRRFQKLLDWMAGKENTPLSSLNPKELLDAILNTTKYQEQFDPEDPEDASRLENIQELLNVASQFESVLQFLENVALVQDEQLPDAQQKENQDSIVMMSLHSAKGLEFEVVFLVGMEDGLLPHSRSLMDPAQMEEERRLCYVGITRAKNYLYFSYAQRRQQYGSTSNQIRSRFLNDIPTELLQHQGNDYQDSFQSSYAYSNRNSSWGNSPVSFPTDQTSKRRYVPLDDDQLEGVLSGEIDVDSFLEQ